MMAKAKKLKSSIKKVESIKKAPPKPKKVKIELTDHEVCDAVSSALWIVEKNVFDQAREEVGHDLPKIREEILRMDKVSQQNYDNILSEIDKYYKISE